MTRTEVSLSPTEPGAGRMWDWTWPDPIWSTTVPALARNRQGVTLSPSQGAKGGAGSTIGGVVQGVDTIDFIAGPSDNQGPYVTFASVMRAHFPMLKGGFLPTVTDDFLAWRFIATMAFSILPTTNRDFGLEIVCGTTEAFPTILLDGITGFGLIYTLDGAVSLLIKGPLGQTITPVTNPATFNPILFHTYEFRMIGATDKVDAVLKVLIDNIPIITLSWGAGTSLPPSTLTGGPGFWPVLVNLSGGNGLAVRQIRCMASQTEAGTL